MMENCTFVNCTESDNNRLAELVAPAAKVIIALNSAIAVFITLGNMLVIMAVWRKSALQTSQNVLVVNLAIADLLVGINTMVKVVNHSYPEIFRNYYSCAIGRVIPIAITLVLSGFFAAGISVERTLAVRNPFTYETSATMRKVCWVAAIIWLYAFNMVVIAAIPGQSIWKPDLECKFLSIYGRGPAIFILSHAFISMCIVIIASVILFRIASFHWNQINTTETIGNIRSQKVSIHIKAAKTLSFVTGSFCICWLPYIILVLYYQDSLTRGIIPSSGVGWLEQILVALVLLKSLLNPVIYARGLPLFKEEFLRILSCGRYSGMSA